ncbi:MAG: glycoside hydrolase family 42 [Verrucomicrobia bacterium]|nr:MAG: glycoside hydrolase family 42 [Verrucomicrobiota bacterium]
MDSHHPVLRGRGRRAQLIVDDRPFLILGGELHNSSASCLRYMAPVWERLRRLHLNTVLAPVTWEQLEPAEGCFDFALVDGLIQQARRHGLRLILLWFGTWKNGMSSYAPAWVKRDCDRFPRVRTAQDVPLAIISPFCPEALAADRAAFAALMRHLVEIDGDRHTVIMVQVENEVGVLGDSRDHSAAANAAFASPVSACLIRHLERNRAAADSPPVQRWLENGAKAHGTWTELFGPGLETDEIFMAWHYARYIDTVAAAGKAEYPLPMFVNAWLSSLDHAEAGFASGGQKPGEWPSGGPLPQTMDIWLAAAPHLDLLAPDIYQPQFDAWCRLYTARDNPLFIPEMNWDQRAARQFFLALGAHHALGVSPFAIDSLEPADDNPIRRSYRVLEQIAPLILEHRGTDPMPGFVLDETCPRITRQLGGCTLEITLDEGFGQNAHEGGGLIIAEGDDTFLGGGFGFQVQFLPTEAAPERIGILAIDEGTFVSGRWTPGRRLNGDEAGRGNRWRFLDYASPDGTLTANRLATGISRCSIYRYR